MDQRTNPSNPSSLLGKTAKAGAWTVGSKLASKLLDFITLLCLARILGPSDFGLVAMAMSVVLIAEAVFEMPIAAALMKHTAPTDDMFHTALTISLIRGIVVALLLCLLAYPLAVFYHEPRLTMLVCVLSLAPFMRGLRSPKMMFFAQRFDFRREFAVEATGKVASLIISLAIAIHTGSYWAIAAGTIAGPIIMMAVSYIFAPQRFVMSLKGWSIFAPVVGWNMLAQILQSVNWQLEKLLLPRFMDLVSFGQYSVSSDITAVPFQAVVQPLYRPFYVAFLKVPNRAELGDLFLRSTWTLVFFVAPVLVLLSIMSNVIVHVLLGPSWHNAAFILSILPLIAIGMLPTALVSSICFVADTLHLITIKSVIELVCKVILICVLGYFYGLYGILIGQAVSSIISLGISMVIVRTSIGLSLRRQLTQAFRYLLPIFMMGLCAFSEINFRGENTDFMRQMWFAIAMAALSLLVYIGSVCVVGRLSAPATSHEYEFLVRLLKKRLRPAT